MDPEIVDLTNGDDFDVLMDEEEPSTLGHARSKNHRKYRPPQGPKGPPPYPAYEKDKLKPPGNFWYNRKYHRNSDIPPVDETNPLIGLQYCLPELARYIVSQDGMLQNLNLVAERIYNIGANRLCADEFCQYGRAARPVIPEPKEAKIQDISVSVQDAISSTPRYFDLMNGKVQFCLPTLDKGREMVPAKRTLWSSGMDPKTLALAHASFGGIPGSEAVKAAKSTQEAFKRAKIRTDPKLQSEVRVALDQILARKKMSDASSNTHYRRTKTKSMGTMTDWSANQRSVRTQCNRSPRKPETTSVETSMDETMVPGCNVLR